MPRARFISLQEVGSLIPDNSVVSVSSSSALACPDATLKAIGDYYRQTGRPRELTSIHPIAAGDMYGIAGVDHLAQPGLVRRVVAGSLPSGPSSMASPEIWKLIIEDRIEAYNLPSGIIFHMHREGAARRPGVLSKVGLNTFVDPRL
ncbi:MAG: acyl CoA:acetate/3-ketoacid CoA transferase, partial [Verrucomicrobia bacterium]|nr:acyl CoA:acetate/3-ketoacid CoA transferase [Verrucomicrobiota bacterium]